MYDENKMYSVDYEILTGIYLVKYAIEEYRDEERYDDYDCSEEDAFNYWWNYGEA